MEGVNSILNLLGWLLWAAAFVVPRYAVASSKPLTLLSTLRAETPQTRGRFLLLIALVILIGARALAYWNFSPSTAHRLSMDFGNLILNFQSNSLMHMMAYSIGTFLAFLYVYYVWVLCLSMRTRQTSRIDSIQNLINQQLGFAASWHPCVKILIGGLLGAGLWFAFGMSMIGIKVLSEEGSWTMLFWQSMLMVASFWVSFLLVILAVIALHFVNSYVYLGQRAMWDFIDETAKLYLSIFRRLPLIVGRFDFAPLFGGLVYWLLFEISQWALRAVS